MAIDLAGAARDLDESEAARLRQDLLASPPVHEWLGNLLPLNYGGHSELNIHGTRDTNYENAMGKLTQLGLRAGLGPFDERTAHWRDLVLEDRTARYRNPLNMGYISFIYHRTLIAAFLGLAGYRDPVIHSVLADRLNALYQFTRKSSFDIYVDPYLYKGLAPSFRKYVVNRELYGDGHVHLPWIHDIFGFRALLTLWPDTETERKVNTVLDWVMDRACQALPHRGYGTIASSDRGGEIRGWKPDLPGYFGLNSPGFDGTGLVQAIELYSGFRHAREHGWFKESLAHLKGFATGRGTYLFPARYLRDERRGHWVFGFRMGLGEDRRSRDWREIESTFWMTLIESQMGRGE